MGGGAGASRRDAAGGNPFSPAGELPVWVRTTPAARISGHRQIPSPRSPTVTARLRIVICGLFAILLALFALERYLARPEVVFLRDDGAAQWIVHDDPVQLQARVPQPQTVVFRIGFDLESVPDEATLEYAALTAAKVYVGGREIEVPAVAPGGWSHPRRVPIAAHLREGHGEIAIAVSHAAGPPALRARCDALGVATGRSWQSSRGQEWSAARLASERPIPALALEVPSGSASLRSRWPLGVLLFAFGTGLCRVHARRPLAFVSWLARPVHVQWVLLGAWAILGLNNFWRLHADVGFDVGAHLDYVRFIVERGALPLADDGWQMFQMPLFYVLASIPFGLLSRVMDPPGPQFALRWIPLVCGALQILVARRALAAVFVDREDLQSLGLVFVACLPVNLYMSQYVGNEPMAALFSAIAIMLLLEILRDHAASSRHQLLLSLALSAAILSKVTAVLLVPVSLVTLLFAVRGRAGAAAGGRLALFVLVLAGWPFARNWIEYGTPFVFSSSSVNWWQDPGYRVAEDFWRFGRALEHPVFASTAGFWNALYSTMWTDGQMSSLIAVRWFPPWNLPLVFAGTWLALPVATLMAIGAGRGVLRRDSAFVLAVGCVLLYLLALLQQYLSLPIYSTAKASYTLGLMPLYAILVAGGFRAMPRDGVARAVATGLFVAWAGFAFFGYVAA